MRLRQLSVFSVLAVAPLANFVMPLTLSLGDMCVKHTWNTVPSNWETLGPPHFNATIDLHFALKPHHETALIDALYEVSTPGSPKYGAHLSKEEVSQLVAPHSDTLELINSWLAHHRVPPSSISMTHGGGWLTATGVLVSQANEMLGASYQLYRPSGTNDTTILRTVGYALPAVLYPHVKTVVPTTYFASTRSLRRTPGRCAAGAGTPSRELLSNRDDEDEREIEPADLRSLYRTVTYVPAATDRNRLGVAGFLEQYPNRKDLKIFMNKFRDDAIGANFKVLLVNGGGYNRRNPTKEASQNVQYSQAIAYPTTQIFYSSGGDISWIPDSGLPAPDDADEVWLNYLLDQENVPQTISISYGGYEEDVPQAYASAICDLFARLGARGVSVLVPSGNDGVGFGDCIADEETRRVQFIPDFPASCPYVTSVGGTIRQNPEVAATFSGGGFSNYFPRDIYQNPAVPKFLQQLGNQYAGMYNAAGRGIPDISAQALNYYIFVQGKRSQASGTSTAVVAGIISLLNDYLLSRGKKPLGFLNPWLYGLAVVGLNDITSGSNPGCGTEGFSAIAGWDPVTGLGTPDFLNMQAILEFMIQHGTPPYGNKA